MLFGVPHGDPGSESMRSETNTSCLPSPPKRSLTERNKYFPSGDGTGSHSDPIVLMGCPILMISNGWIGMVSNAIEESIHARCFGMSSLYRTYTSIAEAVSFLNKYDCALLRIAIGALP